jgi:hypothetical protein
MIAKRPMTEAEWIGCEDPQAMLSFLCDVVDPRKFRLFACAICHHLIWEQLTDVPLRQAVMIAELYADGLASLDEIRHARFSAGNAVAEFESGTRRYQVASAAEATVRTDWAEVVVALHSAYGACATDQRRLVGIERRSKAARQRSRASWAEAKSRRAVAAKLLRDIFGNRFRTLPPRPEAIAPFAEEIYAGAWDNMPILGECLQENG